MVYSFHNQLAKLLLLSALVVVGIFLSMHSASAHPEAGAGFHTNSLTHTNPPQGAHTHNGIDDITYVGNDIVGEEDPAGDGNDIEGEENTARVGIEFDNPIEFNTVESLLAKVLRTIQSIVAVLAILFIVIGAVIYITSGGNQQRTELAKNAIGASLIGLALAVAAPSFLKEIYTALGSSTDETLVTSSISLTQIALNVLKFLLSIVGILSILMLVTGGLMYMLSAGDQGRTETAKKIVLYSVIGLIVALTSLVVVSQLVGVLGVGT